jgi:hypothetical protein
MASDAEGRDRALAGQPVAISNPSPSDAVRDLTFAARQVRSNVDARPVGVWLKSTDVDGSGL